MTFCFYPYPPFKNVMKIFGLSFSFRDMQVDSFAILSLVSIIVQLDSALNIACIRSSRPEEVFLGKCILKMCNKFTGEHMCRNAIY